LLGVVKADDYIPFDRGLGSTKRSLVGANKKLPAMFLDHVWPLIAHVRFERRRIASACGRLGEPPRAA
jgi:hypothetical protein